MDDAWEYILYNNYLFSLLFDDNKIKMARTPEKEQKENPARCTGEGKI